MEISGPRKLSLDLSMDGEVFTQVTILQTDSKFEIMQKIRGALNISSEDQFELFQHGVQAQARPIEISFPILYRYEQIQIAMTNPFHEESLKENNQEQFTAVGQILHSDFKDIAFDQVIRKRYKCFFPSCRKTFDEIAGLFYHQKIHTDNKPYQCPKCSKRFISKTHLRSHSDIHLTDRPYKCSQNGCNKSYSKLNRLQTHIRTHTSNKIFKCPVQGCFKSFNEKGILKTHLRIHTGDKPYKCAIAGCLEQYSTKSILQEHIKKAHKESTLRSQEPLFRAEQSFHEGSQSKPSCKTSTQDVSNMATMKVENLQNEDLQKEADKSLQGLTQPSFIVNGPLISMPSYYEIQKAPQALVPQMSGYNQFYNVYQQRQPQLKTVFLPNNNHYALIDQHNAKSIQPQDFLNASEHAPIHQIQSYIQNPQALPYSAQPMIMNQWDQSSPYVIVPSSQQYSKLPNPYYQHMLPQQPQILHPNQLQMLPHSYPGQLPSFAQPQFVLAPNQMQEYQMQSNMSKI